MKKIFILGFLLSFLCIYNVQGEESPKNVITFGPYYSSQMFFFLLPSGINIGYERLLNNYFSVGLNIGMNFFWPNAEIQGRYYPSWSKTFFTGFGIGIWASFPVISPEIGWKMNIGETNRWVIIPHVIGHIFLDGFYAFPYNLITTVFEIGLKVGYKF